MAKIRIAIKMRIKAEALGKVRRRWEEIAIRNRKTSDAVSRDDFPEKRRGLLCLTHTEKCAHTVVEGKLSNSVGRATVCR